MTAAPPTVSLLGALIRATALEAELAKLRPEGLPAGLRGPLPVSPGVQAALVAARRAGPPDALCLRRASPAALVALGVSAESLLHEAAGSPLASAAGRSGGGVPADPAGGVIGAVESPGAMMEVMAGVALAFRLRDEPRVAILVDVADDAASGHWHEGLNLAAVQGAPLVVVVDASARHPLTAAVPRLATRSPAYGLHGVVVESDAPLLILDAIAAAVDRARAGNGTQLVEVAGDAGADPVDRLLRLDPALGAFAAEARAAAEQEVRAPVTALASVPPRPPSRRPSLRPREEV